MFEFTNNNWVNYKLNEITKKAFERKPYRMIQASQISILSNFVS